ncbi:flippase [Tenacibaculum sp. SSH1-16]|uniref:flippase n=1 Tax=Tenacibaculum sp. SSH1-16 TaxID=3136667 RepID=UPI0032C3F906|nr:flippase [Tenacibaculum mesophilum]
MKLVKGKYLIYNFISLFTLQGLNYILPLITVPYLLRVLDVELFGLLSFATAFVMYFVVLTNYGFQLTATRMISIHRNDKDKINEIFSSVMMIKFFLLLLSVLLLLIIVFSVKQLRIDMYVYFLAFGTVIGQVLFPVWFFQGMERMKYITYINIISKSFFTLLMFVFVKNKSDYLLVPFFTSMGFIASGVLSLIIIRLKFNVQFHLQKFYTLKEYLYDGWHVFVANVYTNLYSTTNVVLLGFVTNNTIVGYYSVAEKITGAVSGLFLPVNQALYPYLSRVFSQDKKKFIFLTRRISLVLLVLSLLFFTISYYFTPELVYLVSGKYNDIINFILSVLLFRVLSSPFSNLYSNILIIMKEKSKYMKVMNITVLLNFLFVFPSIYLFHLNGFLIAFVPLLWVHTALLYKYVREVRGEKQFFKIK